ncbi:MAG: aminotransferase class I/II-fold pyridoxal phosphate-dependent enzyme [Planctomycetaceae bacterium]|nr:aminotransferase class I/II-fold pyridoxal phosphate-dependent enzyme [Planctomycetaceae bacterium]
MYEKWLADRTQWFDASGIRKVFDLASKLKNPVNLSIGQPDFDAPDSAKQAAIEAISSKKNGYTPTQGAAALRTLLQKQVDDQYGPGVRETFVSSGTSGSLFLALMTLVNPGDEVIIFDPFFVMYDALVRMLGAKPVYVSTYPDFHIDVNKVEAAITDKTKLIILNSPANPTGTIASEQVCRDLAELADRKQIALISDEIYKFFCYDGEFASPAKFSKNVIVLDGYSKCYGVPGWRLGFAHGPSEIIQQMLKFQQYTFVCAPSALQYGIIAALDTDMEPLLNAYRRKRDLVYDGLKDHFEIVKSEGAFYSFPKAPPPSAAEFVNKAILERELLVIPGNVFSSQDSHFRISFAASDETIAKGVEILVDMVKK